MKHNVKAIVSTVLALLLYAGFLIGMGFIWNLFWKVGTAATWIYWVSKALVILIVVICSLVLLFGKNKGISAIQLFFAISLSVVPLLLRALCMIPVAGVYIAGILGFILIFFIFLAMIGFMNYPNGSSSKK